MAVLFGRSSREAEGGEQARRHAPSAWVTRHLSPTELQSLSGIIEAPQQRRLARLCHSVVIFGSCLSLSHPTHFHVRVAPMR